jgi:hypothetical protein
VELVEALPEQLHLLCLASLARLQTEQNPVWLISEKDEMLEMRVVLALGMSSWALVSRLTVKAFSTGQA